MPNQIGCTGRARHHRQQEVASVILRQLHAGIFNGTAMGQVRGPELPPDRDAELAVVQIDQFGIRPVVREDPERGGRFQAEVRLGSPGGGGGNVRLTLQGAGRDDNREFPGRDAGRGGAEV